MTVLEWLGAIDGYNLGEPLYRVIGIKRGIADVSITQHIDVDNRTLRLLEVDIVWYAMMYLPAGSRSSSVSDGGFQQSEGQMRIMYNERKQKLLWCDEQYGLLDDDMYSGTSKIRFHTNPLLK